MVNRIVEGIEEKAGRIKVKTILSVPDTGLKEKDRGVKELEVEKVLVCIGRKSNAPGVGLGNVGVNMDDKGWIITNDMMETSTPGLTRSRTAADNGA